MLSWIKLLPFAFPVGLPAAMPGFKHAALLGLASGDRSFFAPAAAPFAQLTAPVSAPAVAGPVYALGGDAITQPVAQPPVQCLAC